MSRRYRILFGVVLVAALALTVLSRMPRGTSGERASATKAPVAELAIEIRDGAVVPARMSVPKGHLVRLTVVNGGPAPVRLELGGYGHAFSPLALEAGGTWEGDFLADLPGEDFPWLVDGEPAGQLRVTGSHLVEDHR